jgi:hypothetical protein
MGLMYVNVLVGIAGVLFIISKFVDSYETLMFARLIAGLYCGFFTGKFLWLTSKLK